MNNKRRMKWIARVMALVLTGTLMLGGAAAVKPVTAYAAGSSIIDRQTQKGSLIINKTGENSQPLAGATFKIYKVMSLTPGTTAGEYAKYEKVEAFKDKLPSADALGNYSAAQIENVATELKAIVDNGTVTAVDTQTTAESTGTATFSNLDLGYYLVIETNAPATYVAGKPFLVAIPSTNNYNQDGQQGTAWEYNVTVEPKNAKVTINKKLAAEDPTDSKNPEQDGTVAVGNFVKYEVTTTIPKYPDNYFEKDVTFNIIDKMSAGLEAQTDGITVTVGGATVQASEDTYSVTVKTKAQITAADDKDLTIAFAKKYIKENPGKTVVVTYYARVTSAAVTGNVAGNKNSASLKYNNQPGITTEAGPSEVKVYSFNIQVEKFANDGTKTGLEGAEFGLYSDKECTNPVANTTVSSTDGNGILKFAKLDADTYYLKETKSPAGYTLLANPIEVKIDAIADGNFKLYVDGKEVPSGNTAQFTTRYNVSEGTAYVAVENHKGFSLPSTGGAGIAMFLIVGAAGIILVSVAFTRKSRKAN